MTAQVRVTVAGTVRVTGGEAALTFGRARDCVDRYFRESALAPVESRRQQDSFHD